MLGEFELIKKIRKKFLCKKESIVGIGDDCAVIKSGKKYLLYTIDSMVEGVHFNMKFPMNWSDVGYKSVVRAISDIAAMGGIPEYVLIALSLRKDLTNYMFKNLVKGIEKAVNEYGIILIGGDITSSKVVSLVVSVIGSCDNMPVLRSGAKIGDDIYITGYTGLSSLGLYILKKNLKTKNADFFIESYKKPMARIDLGRNLLSFVHSMIDISDGVIGDLKHILEESNVGAIIEKDLIPVHDGFLEIDGLSKNRIYDFVLNGGDDYELLFTAPQKNRKKIEKISIKLKAKITRIGSIVNKGLYIKENGKVRLLKSKSYEHFKS